MTHRQVETSREARLWIGQVIVPGITVAASLMSIPEVRRAVCWKAREVKYSVQNKINNIRKGS